MLKKLGILSGILISLSCGAGGYMFWQLESDLTPSDQKNKVLGLPASYALNAPIVPYSGPHPANIKRPQETFEFPIKIGETGPVKPLFAGAQEYPFLCMSEDSGLGQPKVDNQQGAGVAVYATQANGEKDKNHIIGYSKDCSLPTQIHYFYQTQDNPQYQALGPNQLPKDNPQGINWLRVETGTINRFIYALILPTSDNDTPTHADTQRWNKRLIYHFKGGISMGFKQGVLRLKHIHSDMQAFLNQGYAIAYSTGNETSSHYNMWLAEDTALRVKKQFTSQYGNPDYTVGMGGSGGGLQQYLLAQNHPGIIDAGLALFSYPDMVTQTPYALDCELLEYYFDNLAKHNLDWQAPNLRESVLGLTTTNKIENAYKKYSIIIDLFNFRWPDIPQTASTCTNGWRGSHASIHNPKYNGDYYRFSNDILSQVQFSHWNNLVNFYGTDANGWANSLYDNQGVQYGLNALKNKQISVETFLHLNSHIGSWKPQQNMTNEYYWHVSGKGGLKDFKLWSQHNMTHEGLAQPLSPRAQANPDAIKAAYLSGQIYQGKLGIPMIDLRPYRDDMLDIHHSWASFSARLRMQDQHTNLGEQIIWTTRPPYKGYDIALDAIDRWMTNIKQNPNTSVADNRPKDLADRCYDHQGDLIYNGDDAWNGAWNNQATGPCTLAHPPKSSSRIVAGDSYHGETLKCALQSVETAINQGVYAPLDMTPYRSALETVFPQGVCDYQQPPQGKPTQVF